MLRFEPLIASFIDSVLRALRDATLDELRELLAEGDRPARPGRPRKSPRAKRGSGRQAVPRATRPTAPARARPAAKPGPRSNDPPVVDEITDPERLLAAIAPIPALLPG